MSDSPKVKIYEIKSRIKNLDLPKERDRETERQRDTERDRETQTDRQTDRQTEGSLLIPNFSNLTCCPLNC